MTGRLDANSGGAKVADHERRIEAIERKNRARQTDLDKRTAIPKFGTSVVAETTFGQSPALGASGRVADALHTHGTPGDPGATTLFQVGGITPTQSGVIDFGTGFAPSYDFETGVLHINSTAPGAGELLVVDPDSLPAGESVVTAIAPSGSAFPQALYRAEVGTTKVWEVTPEAAVHYAQRIQFASDTSFSEQAAIGWGVPGLTPGTDLVVSRVRGASWAPAFTIGDTDVAGSAAVTIDAPAGITYPKAISRQKVGGTTVTEDLGDGTRIHYGTAGIQWANSGFTRQWFIGPQVPGTTRTDDLVIATADSGGWSATPVLRLPSGGGMSVNTVVGIAAPSPQLRVNNNGADSGAFVFSTAAHQAILAGGAAYDSTAGAWLPKATTASMVVLESGGVSIRADAGLTVGTAYTPTERLSINGTTGAVNVPGALTRAGNAVETQNNKGAVNGYAGLGSGGLVPAAQLGTGATTTNFLRGDGVFATPGGGGGGGVLVPPLVWRSPTIIYETFNRADGANFGTPFWGPAWGTTLSGAVSISSSKGVPTTLGGDGWILAPIDPGTQSGRIEARVGTGTLGIGILVARILDLNTIIYVQIDGRPSPTGQTVSVWRRDDGGGGYANIASVAYAAATSTEYLLAVDITPTTIAVSVNGVSVIGTTTIPSGDQTLFGANTRVGVAFVSTGAGTYVDDFKFTTTDPDAGPIVGVMTAEAPVPGGIGYGVTIWNGMPPPIGSGTTIAAACQSSAFWDVGPNLRQTSGVGGPSGKRIRMGVTGTGAATDEHQVIFAFASGGSAVIKTWNETLLSGTVRVLELQSGYVNVTDYDARLTLKSSATGAGVASFSAEVDAWKYRTSDGSVLPEVYGSTGGLWGSVAAAGTSQAMFQHGSTVLTTNGTGDGFITYPAAFPNGVAMVMATNGDPASTGTGWVVTGASSGTGFVVHVESAAGPVASTLVRINWIAIGH